MGQCRSATDRTEYCSLPTLACEFGDRYLTLRWRLRVHGEHVVNDHPESSSSQFCMIDCQTSVAAVRLAICTISLTLDQSRLYMTSPSWRIVANGNLSCPTLHLSTTEGGRMAAAECFPYTAESHISAPRRSLPRGHQGRLNPRRSSLFGTKITEVLIRDLAKFRLTLDNLLCLTYSLGQPSHH